MLWVSLLGNQVMNFSLAAKDMQPVGITENKEVM